MPKKLSRSARWQNAVTSLRLAADTYKTALEDLEELRVEYEDWKTSLQDKNQDSTPTADLLDVLCDLDFDGQLDDVENFVIEVEDVEAPRGFGRDKPQ